MNSDSPESLDGGDPHAAQEPGHEQLMASVLSGELAIGSTAAAELLRCPVCAARIEGLRSVAGRLDAAGVEARQSLQEVLEPSSLRRPWFALAAAAAAAMLIVCVVFVPMPGCGRAAGTERDQLLGPGAVDGWTPSGAVAAATPWWPFRWPADTGVLEARYLVEVRAVDAAGVASKDPIVVSQPLREPTWTPSEGEQRRLQECSRILWSVIVTDMATGANSRTPAVLAFRP